MVFQVAENLACKLVERYDRNGDGVVSPDEMPPGLTTPSHQPLQVMTILIWNRWPATKSPN